jgi:hypothetical protein
MGRTLHCLAFGREGAWEAICLDLDIAVQGTTFDDAARSLNTAIALHLESLDGLPDAERHRLSYRPVPLSARLRFAARALALAFSRRNSGTYQHQYTMPSPA